MPHYSDFETNLGHNTDFFAVYVIIPIFQSITLSFYQWDGLGPLTFIGLDNYRELADDDNFIVSIKNNITRLVLYMLAIPAGLALALFQMSCRHCLTSEITSLTTFLTSSGISFLERSSTRV